MTSDKHIQVKAPSSKSLSHRALIAGAMSPEPTVVLEPLDSNDINRTMDCLSTMGAKFDINGSATTVSGFVDGPRGGLSEPAILEMRDSGTTCRLITAVAAAGKGLFRVQGTPRMHQRPISALTAAIRSQGGEVTFAGRQGYPPMTIDSKGFAGGSVDISLEDSSQYLSGLLLSAPLAREEMIINVTGRKAVSWPYVALTLSVMEGFRVPFTVEILKNGNWEAEDWKKITQVVPGEIRFRVKPSQYDCNEFRVESDWSSASYFAAAGAVGTKPVMIKGVSVDSMQGDRAILDILTKMGAQIDCDKKGVLVHPSKLKGVEVDMGLCPDLVPTVCAVAAFAEGPTVIKNVAHLRIKECDRLEASATELIRAGGKAEVFKDSIKVIPGELKKGERIVFSTYDDHRLAMSTAIYGLAGINAVAEDPGCVAKSFPGFWDEWKKVLKGNGC